MKNRTICFLMGYMLFAGQFAVLAQTNTTRLERSTEPALVLKEAVALAEKYVAGNKIDVSKHFIESATAIYTTDNPQGGWVWRITWALKQSAKGGQIYVFVGMDKSTSIVRGR